MTCFCDSNQYFKYLKDFLELDELKFCKNDYIPYNINYNKIIDVYQEMKNSLIFSKIYIYSNQDNKYFYGISLIFIMNDDVNSNILCDYIIFYENGSCSFKCRNANYYDIMKEKLLSFAKLFFIYNNVI